MVATAEPDWSAHVVIIDRGSRRTTSFGCWASLDATFQEKIFRYSSAFAYLTCGDAKSEFNDSNAAQANSTDVDFDDIDSYADLHEQILRIRWDGGMWQWLF